MDLHLRQSVVSSYICADINEELIEITEKVRYSFQASFNRAFKKQFRLNPDAMRRDLNS